PENAKTSAGSVSFGQASISSTSQLYERSARGASHALEQLPLLALELVGRDHAPVAQLGELGDLRGDACTCGIVTAHHRPAHRVTDRVGVLPARTTHALVHAAVDLLLHTVGVTHVVERRRALLPR